ncbi:molybdenum cofactor guanylyltransferase [Actinokineospora pegani]|uniref:molybdenum cofactor guanylyltransferase n=1 Tax=Actinokineospora pegani TaxID=2654637 RepID=UPI0012E9ED28|nr:NTP transferase domain-containing protein [Actinokineospora pegani]
MRAGIVVAGGAGRRLGGVDKPALVVGGRTLLDRALDALGEVRTVVVGPERATSRPVEWTREDPAGTGPVAAVRAGVERLSDLSDEAVVVLLAADLPAVTPTVVRRVADAVGESGAVLVDAAGREQWLLSAWRLGALRRAVPVEAAGLALRRVLAGLAPVAVDDVDGAAGDIDTPDDLTRLDG